MALSKWIVLGTSLTLLSAALVGCGTQTATAPTVKAGTSVPKGQTITLWSWQGPPVYNEVVKIADRWAKAHGDKVTVVNQSNNTSSYQFYATATRAGKGPDVAFGMPDDDTGTFDEEGLLSVVPAADFHAADYSQSVDEALTINGKVDALPDYVQTTALYYNKHLIHTPPVTWKQFVHDANKYGFMFNQKGLYYPFAIVGGMGGYVFSYHNGHLNPKDIGLDNSGAIAGFSLLHQMDSKYHWMTPSTTEAIAYAKFEAGKIGMTISGPWEIPNFEKAGITFGVAHLPLLPNKKSMTPFLGVITTLVNSRSPYQAADWSLAQALSSAKAQLHYFDLEQQIPAQTSILDSRSVQSSATFKAFAHEVPVAVPLPNIPQVQAVWNAEPVLQDILTGNLTPRQGAVDFVKDIQQGIKISG